MLSTLSLPSLPGPLLSRVVVQVKIPFMGQIELFNHLLTIIIIINYLKQFRDMQIIHIIGVNKINKIGINFKK